MNGRPDRDAAPLDDPPVEVAEGLAHDVYNVSTGVATGWQELVDLFRARGLYARWSDEASADIAVGAEPSTQLALIECLVQRNDPTALPAMTVLANDGNATVRMAAIAARLARLIFSNL